MGLVAVLGIAALFIASTSAVDYDYDCEPTSPHNLKFGSRQAGDSLLYSTLVQIDGIWFMVRDATVSWPLENQISDANITALTVKNRMAGEDGACVQLVEGGPGNSNVTLYVNTQRGSGADSIIYVYGFGF